MSIRIEKINDLVRDSLSEIFGHELSFKKGILVSISKVDTTADLKNSLVYLSVFPESEKNYVEKTIQHEIGKLQKCLNQKLQTRILPRLKFIMDDKQEKISELEKIFEQIRKEKDE